ncbi:ABC transporter ATP-binding protein [Treponema sp.]|uniref:ABC transporter ATP-binding protein n=1 Tax=Treponema sp. TaxID=166 RepID=UPI00298EBD28|nr:ABC transporter ATP-binding protein [Treponema sp.]MCR5614042.1 ABC transporter ATP-binding protein [Treponema sp.]
MSDVLIETTDLCKSFDLQAGFFAKKDKNVFAVNSVNLKIMRGETYGIVGESGCGKTTTARLLIKMYKATSGKIIYHDENGAHDISTLNKKETKLYQEKVKYIFQDPAKSLNPRMTVYTVMTDGLRHSSKKLSEDEIYERAKKAITDVGLTEADLQKRPSEFSGGQRQRISIARGLILEPDLLICDEVVSALDVSIQAQVLNLLSDLRKKNNLSFLFITHDLRVACFFCDRIGVMYRGVLVEEGPAKDLYKNAVHPYTKLLFEAASGITSKSSVEVKTVLEQEKGCPFAHRCPKATDRCFAECPEFKSVGADGASSESGSSSVSAHTVRCWEA